jgi:signal transduction histidine kinase
MRGFMLRIFVWFWLALGLMGAALVLIWIIEERGPVINRIRATLQPIIAAEGTKAVDIFERDGSGGLAAYLSNSEAYTGFRIYLLDSRGEEVSLRPSRSEFPAVAALARRAMQSGHAEYRLALRETWASIPVCSNQGHCYWFVSIIPHAGGDALRSDFRLLILRLVAVLAIGAAVCYWLARSITAPILQLRHATQRIAAGDLRARVSSQLENRTDEIAGLAQDFNLMADRIATLLESQRRLLGDISHELRSPLTRLNISLELARQAAGSIAAEDHDRIERESERLNLLIGQLLTLSRVENGEATPEFVEIDLAQMIREITADADFEARSRDRSVRMEIETEAVVRGVPELLRSAIENIVRNAVAYTAAGTEVVIHLGVSRTLQLERFVVRVTDQGGGVPPEALPHLFRPFYRVEDARDRQSGGTGLGLAIADRTIRLFGGRIIAANRPEGGLSVEILFPGAAIATVETQDLASLL